MIKGCSGKFKYIEIKSAQTIIERLNKKPMKKEYRDKGPLQVYTCRNCGFFHIGHQGNRKR